MSKTSNYMSLYCALCLLGAGTPGVQADPVALPGTGISSNGINTNELRFDYNPQNRKISFSAVSTTDCTEITACEASFKKENTTSPQPTENFHSERHSSPTDWYVIVDESNSMRIRKDRRIYLQEALAVVTELLKKSSGTDTVSVHLVSSEMTQLGSTANTAKLSDDLKKLGNDASSRKGHTHQRTAIFHYGCKLINSLPATDGKDGRKRILLLLTDGEDDASAPGESDDLIAAANHSNKRISIHCVTFFKAASPRNTQVNTFERICTKTQGYFVFQNSACNNTTAAALADALIRNQHRSACSFSLAYPEKKQGAELQLNFRLSGSANASLTLTADALQAACDLATGTDGEIDTLVADITTRVNAAAATLTALAEAEVKTPPDTKAVGAAIAELCKQASELLPICRTLKGKDAGSVNKAIERAGKKENITGAETATLSRLQQLMANQSLNSEQLTDAHMLELLGRTSPLPYPGVSAIQQLLSRLNAADVSLKSLAEAETAQQPDLAIISRESFSLRRKAADMLTAAKQLKNTPPVETTRALDMFRGRPEIPEQVKNNLGKIQAFYENKELTAENLTADHMLALIGRNTPLPTPELNTIKPMRDIISRNAPAVAELTRLETDSPTDTEAIQKAAAELRPGITELTPLAVALKNLHTEAVTSTLQEELDKEGITDGDKEIFTRILSYSEEKELTPDKVTEQHVLNLLGRVTPLPEPLPEQPTPTWLYPAIGGGGVLLAVLIAIGIYIARMRRIWSTLPQVAPLTETTPSPVKPIGVVPVNTPGITSDKVLAVLDEPGTNNQWWIIEPLINIGRSPENDLVLAPADRTVSARHCTIKQERDGSWAIYDLGTPNKIYYNNEILSHLVLSQGIIFELGSVKLRFHANSHKY